MNKNSEFSRLSMSKRNYFMDLDEKKNPEKSWNFSSFKTSQLCLVYCNINVGKRNGNV